LRNKKPAKQYRIRINDQIRADEVRVITDDESLGVMSTPDALKEAQNRGLDLLEISPKAKPPVAKITDYGKYQYEQKKKAKEAKAKAKTVETKNVQVKIGTSEGDLLIKAKNISEWLVEGHRVKLDLFLRGRSKYMEQDFLKTRLDRVLHFVSESFKIADGPKKSPKGLTVILERDTKKKKDDDTD
tara:strand:- start:196 stop:753 length:558 start_codon:yes stop_codon:yes gene_type:complete